MKKAIAILLLTHSLFLSAQETRIDNAYYLAKAICNAENVNKTDARKILGGLLWYFEQSGAKRPGIKIYLQENYASMRSLFDTLLSKVADRDILLSSSISFLKTDRNKSARLSDFLDLRGRYDALVKKDSIETENLSRIKRLLDDEEALLKQKKADTVSFSAIDIEETTRLVAKYQTSFDSATTAHNQTATARYSFASRILNHPIADSLLLNVYKIKPQRMGETDFAKEQLNYSQIISSREVIVDQPDLSPLSFKLPSQSQVIDALAIYLAKRVKQESVMWFFETLQNNVKAYTLIQDFFPGTLSLLQSKEVYEIPNFGSAWRYALSKDFVQMPQHVFQSDWIKKQLGSHGKVISEALEISWDIAKMVEQHYNYNDIISSLYLDHKPSGNENSLQLMDLVSLLYAINNEFVSINSFRKDSLRKHWLSYEDLLYMSDQEFQVMLSLVDGRYNRVFSKLLTSSALNGFEISKDKLNQVRRWLGSLLLKINQIQKLRDEYKALKDQKDGLAKFEYSNYNTWRFLQDLLRTLQFDRLEGYDGLFKKIENSALPKALNILVDVQEGYELLQQKNFAGALDILLSVVDSVISVKSKDIKLADLKASLKIFQANEQRVKQLLTNYGGRPGDDCKVVFRSTRKSGKLIPGNEISISTYSIGKIISEQSFEITLAELRRKIPNIDTVLKNYAVLPKYLDSMEATIQLSSVAFDEDSPLAFLLKRQDTKALKIVRELAAFLNDVSQAENSKALSKAIESYALPPGSYKKKRNSWKSVDLAAFIGPYSGYEWVKSSTNTDAGFVYGITAPIGISFSKTFARKINTISEKESLKNPDLVKIGRNSLWKRRKLTLTWTVSIIDIGAVVSYRFNKQDTVLPQEVKWTQLISPGFHFNVGLPSTPLVVSAGIQRTPELRSFKDDNRQRGATRVYLGLMFDIPLFNLWTKSELVRNF